MVDEPDQPAGSLGRVTYRRLYELAQAQAARLDQLGVPQGARVAIVSQNSARLLVGFYGVSAWGRVYVPINFRLSSDEIAYIVEHCGATVLLVDPELVDVVKGIEVRAHLRAGTATTTRSTSRASSPSRGSPTRTPPPPSTTRRAPRRGPRACR